MAIEKSITVETKDVGPGRDMKNKRFAYKPNTVSNGYDPYPNVIPIGPIPHERPWFENDEEAKEGIFSHLAQMGESELRELYGGYLFKFGFKENEIMQMPMKELEYLFNQIINV
ncbi:MAG TPA: hypothetical protein DCS66_00050 [Flavobacteriaceae bacterium]|nr:hypothetical protein [Flavobacteriaceae bacterium]